MHNKELLIKELDRLGVNYNVRRLQVGDFLWVAQHVSGTDCYMIDYRTNESLDTLQWMEIINRKDVLLVLV